MHQYKDVNIMLDVFQNKLIEIIDSNDPYITLSKKQSKLRHKPWITSSILKSIKNKTPFYKKLMKTKNEFWFDRYKHYRNILNCLIAKSKKKKHLRDFFQKHHQNPKKVWTKINKILKNKTKINEYIYLSENGTTLLDTSKIASKFNNYFINVS